MRPLKSAAYAATIAVFAGTAGLIATVQPASARIVCNADGDCWHTDKVYRYHREWRVESHPDSWYFHQDWTAKDRRYHEHHDERGYYRNGVWVTF